MAVDQDYVFSLESEVPLFNFSIDKLYGSINTFVVQDDMSVFFSYFDIIYNDTDARYIELVNFVEFLDSKLRFGIQDSTGESKNASVIENEYYWHDTQAVSGNPKFQNAGGEYLWSFVSSFRKQDSIKSKSFEGEISDIVEQIARTYVYPGDKGKSNIDDKLFISKTNNQGIWYQPLISDVRFFLLLADFAVPANQAGNDNAPFYTFVNTLGEFYFMDMWSLMNQPVTATYYLIDHPETVLDEETILSHKIYFNDVEEQLPLYHVDFFKIGSTGNYSSKGVKQKDNVVKLTNKDTRTVREKDLANLRSFRDLGIEETPEDTQALLGLQNHFFKNTAISYRMTISVKFNPKLAAGKIVYIDIPSAFQTDKVIFPEASGKWLTLASTHSWFPSEKGNFPITTLDLVRPTTNIYKRNTEKNKFAR